MSAFRKFAVAATLACALFGAMAAPANAGGPLVVVNNQPAVYPGGGTSITLNLDLGPLGSFTNLQAKNLVQNAIGLWNGVGTSTMRLTIGPSLPTDATLANLATYINNASDGLNPVIFDTDGTITDNIFGAGASNSVLGFAGSQYTYSGLGAPHFVEGSAVLNGKLSGVGAATWTIVLAHEIGHFFGLDHSQLDNTQGLAQSNYALMYPIAYRTLQSLHEDEQAAVTSLYPSAGTVSSLYGQLTGVFTNTNNTPILGANLWAREGSTGKVYSVVSDFLEQGNGYFRLYLPAGTYTLNAESIAPAFTGGSSVGPYSSTSSDISFQSPHPITPVALGGGTAQQILITPGCVANATFKLDGSGSVTGNCAASSGTLQFSAASASVGEGGGSVALTVSRVGGATGAASVAYATRGITATSGIDFTSASASLTWAAGDATTRTIVVPILEDSIYEGDETFAVDLSGAAGAALGSPATATVTIVDNESPPFSLVDHYYQAILGRVPDAGGKAFWESEASRMTGLGVDVKEAYMVMAGYFFSSSEYLAKNTSDTQYVTDLYNTFFSRPPDSGGLAYWVGQLGSGLPRSIVMYGFLFSPEFNAYMTGLFGNTTSRAEVYAVVDFYRGILSRLPDTSGFNNWLTQFRTAQCAGSGAVYSAVNQISSSFIASSEYVGRNRTNAEYVGDLYYAFLRRGGDLPGVNYWINRLNLGTETRSQMRLDFINTPEFNARVNAIIAQGCYTGP